jgi:single-strand DNA-binding protein
MALNSINIMGNLTRDPELKYTPSGKAVCSLSIANNRIYVKNNERVTEVSYFDVEVWGVIAENCVKYLKKGNGIIVEGRLRQDRWEKDGKTQSRVRIAANNIHFMPKKREEPAGEQFRPEVDMPVPTSTPEPIPTDDIAWDEK